MSKRNGVELHEPQFKGCWLPAEIMELFWNGTLNAKEMMLLATIDSLVRSYGSRKGCYASNEWLAEQMHLKHWRSVSRMVSKLRRLKLVREVRSDGRKRYLETRWSRVRKG